MHKLIDIGHSRGVRIPKQLIQQAKLEGSELRFELLPQGLLIKPYPKNKREGWVEALKNVSSIEFEEIFNVTNRFDDEDWLWETKV